MLYNRIKATDLRHDLGKALSRTADLPFKLQLSDTTRSFIEYLDESARFRYLEISYHIYGPKLVELDKSVWELRRYCRPLNYEINRPDGSRLNLLQAEINTIEAASQKGFHKFRIIGGRLERILQDKEHAARSALVWNNMFFGRKRRLKVAMEVPLYAENAPLYLHPEILDEVLKFVFLPKDVIEAYRAELARHSESSGDTSS